MTQKKEEASADLELEKLNIEREKLIIEKAKIKWTAFSVIVPVIALMATISYGAWSLNEQSELNFQLEIAKSLMQASSPQEATGRADFYRAVFPERFTKSFALHLDPSKYGDDTAAGKVEFVKLIASRGLTAKQTYELWKTVFDGDQWAREKNIGNYFDKVRITR